MNIYKISCYSPCGSYFACYLQSVTVAAESEEQALTLTKEWLDKEDREFIKKDEKDWEITVVKVGPVQGVLDWHEDSDY